MADEDHPEDTGKDPEVPLDLLELFEVLEWERLAYDVEDWERP